MTEQMLVGADCVMFWRGLVQFSDLGEGCSAARAPSLARTAGLSPFHLAARKALQYRVLESRMTEAAARLRKKAGHVANIVP
jgi:hypothetical protein